MAKILSGSTARSTCRKRGEELEVVGRSSACAEDDAPSPARTEPRPTLEGFVSDEGYRHYLPFRAHPSKCAADREKR